jgi:hypothetical protein
MTHSLHCAALAEALREAISDFYELYDGTPYAKKYEGALAAYEAEPGGWRTMESAPKDGTRILVVGGEWNGDVSTSCSNHMAVMVEWLGLQWSVCDTDYYSAWITNPTHWQPSPLPPPPETMG